MTKRETRFTSDADLQSYEKKTYYHMGKCRPHHEQAII